MLWCFLSQMTKDYGHAFFKKSSQKYGLYKAVTSEKRKIQSGPRKNMGTLYK